MAVWDDSVFGAVQHRHRAGHAVQLALIDEQVHKSSQDTNRTRDGLNYAHRNASKQSKAFVSARTRK